MPNEYYYILIGVIALFLIFVLFGFKKRKPKGEKPLVIKEPKRIESREDINPDGVAIVEKYMFRKEMKMLRFLNEILPATYITFAKVNVGNLFEPKGFSKTTYNALKEYFVDFVVFEEATMKPILIVDLYDNSFEDELLKDKAPELVKVCEKINLKVLSFAYRNNLDEVTIKSKLFETLKLGASQEKKGE